MVGRSGESHPTANDSAAATAKNPTTKSLVFAHRCASSSRIRLSPRRTADSSTASPAPAIPTASCRDTPCRSSPASTDPTATNNAAAATSTTGIQRLLGRDVMTAARLLERLVRRDGELSAPYLYGAFARPTCPTPSTTPGLPGTRRRGRVTQAEPTMGAQLPGRWAAAAAAAVTFRRDARARVRALRGVRRSAPRSS